MLECLKTRIFIIKFDIRNFNIIFYFRFLSERSSVVELHVANVTVVGSTPIARSILQLFLLFRARVGFPVDIFHAF